VARLRACGSVTVAGAAGGGHELGIPRAPPFPGLLEGSLSAVYDVEVRISELALRVEG
jgi:hypothetical protein